MVHGVRVVFVKSPDLAVLSKWFKRMESESICLFFSDDACVSLRTSEGMLYFNLDISACDSSNGPGVFETLRELVPTQLHVHLEPLIAQCQLPLHLGYGKEKLIFKPVDYFEYSGSVLTTTLNNIAVSGILAHILATFDPSMTRAAARAELEARLATCGWSCTTEWCEHLEDLQFLKCSPCHTVDGGLRAALNLGVILRSMGQKSGDLPGRGDIGKRAYNFMCGWVAGLRHAGLSELLEVLQECFPPTGQVFYNSNAIERLESGGISNPRLCSVSLMRRYSSTPGELRQLCECIRMAGDSTVGIHLPVTDKIMMKDYGLRCTGTGVRSLHEFNCTRSQ